MTIEMQPSLGSLSTENFPAPPQPEAPAAAAQDTDRAEHPALALVEQLIRDPSAFAAAPEAGDAAGRVRALLVTVAVSAGLFGAVLGSYRGGVQVVYCALKLPLVLLVTLALCAPAVVGIARATGTRLSARGAVALLLGACARFALVLAGLAPVVWLVHGWFGYHRVVITATVVCAAAGVAGAGLLFAGLARAPGRAGRLAGAAIVMVFALVGAHTAWMLRPFVVRPRTERVPFVRAVEGDMLDAVVESTRSAAGIYRVRVEAVRARRDDGAAEAAPSTAEPARSSCEAEGSCD